ncbi:MAG TPA: hypothetical protein VN922_17730 [Bacteroidia bacterium]|nr:hypothetical protein [Bacteroidia bacterium]
MADEENKYGLTEFIMDYMYPSLTRLEVEDMIAESPETQMMMARALRTDIQEDKHMSDEFKDKIRLYIF